MVAISVTEVLEVDADHLYRVRHTISITSMKSAINQIDTDNGSVGDLSDARDCKIRLCFDDADVPKRLEDLNWQRNAICCAVPRKTSVKLSPASGNPRTSK